MSNIKFELDDRQMKQLEEWRTKVKDLYGEVGTERFVFTSTGIGDVCYVVNLTHDTQINLTNTEDW